MARRERNHRLAALLAEAGWSAADLARTVNALVVAQSVALRYDRTAVAHWLTGSRPRPPVPDLVALAFSRRCNRLVTTADTGLTQTSQGLPTRPNPPKAVMPYTVSLRCAVRRSTPRVGSF
ncbi:helix-turn-helix domain-containing protein [Streptomyces sparsus]